MRTFTSASANKYVKQLECEKERLVLEERETCVYERAPGEEMEPPAYDYESMRHRLDSIDLQVRAVRHALHAFNQKQVLPESGMTIDEALIALAQMSAESRRLKALRARRPIERLGSDRGIWSRDRAVEYRYANYDVARAAADSDALEESIAKLQLEIDLVNQTEVFTVDV